MERVDRKRQGEREREQIDRERKSVREKDINEGQRGVYVFDCERVREESEQRERCQSDMSGTV